MATFFLSGATSDLDVLDDVSVSLSALQPTSLAFIFPGVDEIPDFEPVTPEGLTLLRLLGGTQLPFGFDGTRVMEPLDFLDQIFLLKREEDVFATLTSEEGRLLIFDVIGNFVDRLLARPDGARELQDFISGFFETYATASSQADLAGYTPTNLPSVIAASDFSSYDRQTLTDPDITPFLHELIVLDDEAKIVDAGLGVQSRHLVDRIDDESVWL